MSTQHSVAEPEVGQLVFQAVGTLAFDNLDDYITQEELRQLSENYKKVAGFTLSDVGSAQK